MMEPADESQLAEAVAAAVGPLCIKGGGTRPVGGRIEGETLSTAAIKGITLYDPGALTVVVRAGTPLAEIEELLAAEGQRLAFEPMDHRLLMGTKGTSTIGGVVAANVSGPRRIQVGACRDSLIGVRFVDGRGTIIKSGGRVMKNVTGYDLVKLMAGSYGTLGVISEVAFKVLPAPEATASVVIHGLGDDAAVRAMARALSEPYDVSGAAHVPDGQNTLLRLEGFAESVSYRAGKLAAALSDFGDVEIVEDREEVAEQWRNMRNVAAFADSKGDVWRLSVKPSDAPAVVARLDAHDVIYDWGGGLIWALVAAGTDLRPLLQVPGHATLVRASAATRAGVATFQPEPAPLAAISAGLRAQFDPRGILNKGMMG